jgi:hypothetical protein
MRATAQLFSNSGARAPFAGSPDNHWYRTGEHNGVGVEK